MTINNPNLDPELRFRADALLDAMSTQSNISKQRLLSTSRLRAVVEARSCVIYTLIQSGFAYTEVGEVFSKNYSTIVYNYQQIVKCLTEEEKSSKKIIHVLRYLRDINNTLTEQIKNNYGKQDTAKCSKL